MLASLRGPSNLIIDMFRNPKLVKRAAGKVLELWHWCYEKLYGLMKEYMEGTSAWMGIWCPKRWYPIQCDFAYMLSPKLFRNHVLPYLRKHCEELDYTIYHLDGPCQIPHLDYLLDIPELSGIQWVPGSGMVARGMHCGSPVWMPMYKKIQEKGKLLVINVPLTHVKYVLKNLSPQGLLIQTAAQSVKDAVKLLKEASRLSKHG